MTFLLPDPTRFQSGGNHYNQRFLKALKSLGVSFKVAYRLADIADKGPILVDTLLADTPLPPHREKWLIVHHLNSLYPPPAYSAEAYFEAFESGMLHEFDGFLVSSAFTKAYLRKRGLPQACIVAEPGLDPVDNIPERTYHRIEAVMAANLVERKGILPFINSLHAHGPWPLLHIRIFGEARLQPDYARRCRQALSRLPRGIVKYEGAIPQEKMAAAYRQANLFISAAYMETYGMALQEAAAHGLPLLVQEGGNAARHVANGKTGCVCGSISELVSCLKGWQEHLEELQQMGSHARAKALRPQLNWQGTARQFWEQYQAFTS